ncbi:response regulator [Pedobacter boryungensis]|uniref:Response regulator n=1 Tax=Pedobacter boryungensis TaxID=869962 RepID=A0ABX2DAL2_9SPHI|nr:response regulator [Pedobacter boryungensis]NQX31060.1 response regulator [Pedobacter boryungensis]
MNSKILVIDDDKVILFIHKTLMDISGITAEVEYFHDPELALQHILNHINTHTFLLLLDINMPSMSGWDMLDILKDHEFHQNIHVVIITSSVSDLDREKAFTYPQVCEFLTKPLKVADFIALQEHEITGKYLRPV